MRLWTVMAIVMSFATAFAGEDRANKYVMNFDLIINRADGGELYYNVQQQGIHLLPEKPFHGDDLREIDYFLTISELEDGKGTLTVEFYQFETRRKKSDVVSEIVAEVDFTFGSPARPDSRQRTTKSASILRSALIKSDNVIAPQSSRWLSRGRLLATGRPLVLYNAA